MLTLWVQLDNLVLNCFLGLSLSNAGYFSLLTDIYRSYSCSTEVGINPIDCPVNSRRKNIQHLYGTLHFQSMVRIGINPWECGKDEINNISFCREYAHPLWTPSGIQGPKMQSTNTMERQASHPLDSRLPLTQDEVSLALSDSPIWYFNQHTIGQAFLSAFSATPFERQGSWSRCDIFYQSN